jgi:hypothetical protein
MAKDIRDATTIRCIEEQDEARSSHFYSVRYIEQGLLGRAAQEQREAAYHHAQAWMRLERLLGIS